MQYGTLCVSVLRCPVILAAIQLPLTLNESDVVLCLKYQEISLSNPVKLG